MEILEKIKIGTMIDTYVKDNNYFIGSLDDFQEFLENIKLDLIEEGNNEIHQTGERKIPLDDGARAFRLYGDKGGVRHIYYKKFLDKDGYEVYEFCEIY